MYEPFFEFRKRPFPSVPQADLYFPAAAIEAARTTLVRCIRRAEGPALVIGPSGTGKTMLCHVLAREMGDQLRVVLLASGRLGSRRALLQAMLYELGQPYRGLDEGEARLALADYITLSDECPNGVLLLVDEAHTLPLRLLDEVRMTTNLAHEGKPWVRVVLAGGCMLEERFASPKLDSFNQRIAARCYLESFSTAETQQYIEAQTSLAGRRGEALFSEEACRAAHRATDGTPRLINQLCDHALLLACAAGHQQIEARHIEEAWADLQQLPTPWNAEPAQGCAGGDVIEFGRLDDEAECADDETQCSDDAADETPDTIPVLRISAEPDDRTEREPDLDGQVEHIEQMLDQVDAADTDFEPAGSIGPEIELRFDQPHDPFGEEFAEEEVVEDWPATSGRSRGRESDAEPASTQAPAEPASTQAPAEPADAVASEEVGPAPDTEPEPEPECAPARPTVDLEPAAAQAFEAEETVEPEPACALAADTTPAMADAAEQPAAAAEQPHQDPRPSLAVVGEDERDSDSGDAAPTARPAARGPRMAAPPRPKYARLFATLRQG